MKKINIIAILMVTLIFYGCATKGSEITPKVTSKSGNKYTIDLPFSTDYLSRVNFYPIKDVLMSINYTYTTKEILDNALALLLPKFKDVNILLTKFYQDNTTMLILLALHDNGTDQIVPIYAQSELNGQTKLFNDNEHNIEVFTMKTTIDENYNINVTTEIVMKNGEQASDTLSYHIDNNGFIIRNDDKITDSKQDNGSIK